MKSAVKWWLLVLVTINSVALSADELSAEDEKVLDVLNRERVGAGIKPAYQFNAALKEASRRHCLYWSEHYDLQREELKAGEISWHDERYIEGSAYYIGNMRERAKKQGYISSVAENIQLGRESWAGAISSLMSSIGHRLNFLEPALNDIGFYGCRVKSVFPDEEKRLYVFMMGNDYQRVFDEQRRQRCAKEASRYCPSGMTSCMLTPCGNDLGVMESFVKDDADRLVQQQKSGVVKYPFHGAVVEPQGSNYGAYDDSPGPLRGQMISVELLPETQEQIFNLSVELVDVSSGEIVPIKPVSKDLFVNQPGLNAWLPQRPLNWGGQYRIAMKYHDASRGLQTEESVFNVRKPEGQIIRISSLQQTLSVKKGEEKLLAIDWKLTPLEAVRNIKITYWGESANYKIEMLEDNLIKIQSYIDTLVIEAAVNNLKININATE
ncbi:CAP domain-containing protein [Endozoicomonas euniceicola]|uniref:CAP domain-containing protein n=1 Tax=Endozoicomonas euniceicola TaxID=1234143 RepID=A0ABY6GS03_9GAMM|nr:CAP domain-containing protein [Endozoicomonas euniceicola]UYM15528.1 CAP domain-containing protein [Endozoicomonas euniceicola]